MIEFLPDSTDCHGKIHAEAGAESGRIEIRWVLPGKAKDRESRDFRSAAFVNADLNQFFTEIGRGITVAEQPQNLIATGAQRQTAGLSLIETPEDGEVEAGTDFLPEMFPGRFRRTIAPDPIPTFREFVFRIPAENTEI